MDSQRVALLSATFALGALVGCGGHSPSVRPVASAAAGVSSAANPAPTNAAPDPAAGLSVVSATYSGELAVVEFDRPVTPASARDGLSLFRAEGLDPGSAFEASGRSSSLVGGGRVLVLRAADRGQHELRLALTDAVQGVDGQRLRGGQGSAALSFADALPGQVYELRFRPEALAAPGAVAHNASDDHANDVSQATPLRDSADGAIEVAGDRDWFSFEVRDTRPVTVRTETSGDTILSVSDASGHLLETNDDDPNGGRHSVVAFTPAAAGRYFAEVRGYAQTTPSYRLIVTGAGVQRGAGSNAAEALVVQLDASVAETLGPADVDWYQITPPTGLAVRIAVDHPDVTLIALDEAQRPFAEPIHVVAAGETLGGIAREVGLDYQTLAALNGIADPNRLDVGQRLHVPSRESLELRAPGGRVYVRVSGFAGATPSYTIDFRGAATAPPPPAGRRDDHAQTAAGATPLPLGQAVAGRIEEAGDLDWLTVDLQAGKTYILETASAGDTILRLLDPAGVELARNDDAPGGGRHSWLSYRALRDGQHLVEVAGYGSTTPSYTVQATVRAAESLPDPTRFRIRAGTDPWHIDFRLRADLFAQDLASHGLASGDAETDRLMRERVIEATLSFLGEKYGLTPDGGPRAGTSWRVSFSAAPPLGRPGRDHSREAVGGSHQDGERTLGVSYLDPGNRRKEDNDDLGTLGIFSASIDGRDSTLRPALSAADRRYLDGSYLLGDGSSSDDARFRRVRQVASDWAHALAVVTAHEVGHSVGLDHDESDTRGIMQAALSRTLLSSPETRFAAPSAQTLTDNLELDR